MWQHKILHAIAFLTFCSLAGSADAQPNQATFHGIGTLPGENSFAEDVSADGATVAGISGGPAGSKAIRWTQAGGIVVLTDLAGLHDSQGLGISGNGAVVVGFGSDSQNNAVAVRWTPNPSSLPHLAGVRSIPHATSADGSVIVGESDNTNFSIEAVRWSGGAVQGLGFLPSSSSNFSQAFGVSANGAVIVGHGFQGASIYQAFRWTAGAGTTGLGDLPGGTFGSQALAASADGAVIVGGSNSGNGFEAFRWQNNVMMPLGDLPGGFFSSQARDVSADGTVIVGQGNGANGDGAFVWTQSTGIQSVRTVLMTHGLSAELAGWTLSVANAVSADGRTVVGTGTHSGHGEGWIATLPAPDTDGDGLLDDWETNGIPYVDSTGATQRYILNDDADPQSDSNPNHKDIWVEMDAMAGRAPTNADLQPVKDAFALAPAALVNNPDGQPGVQLHAMIDETNLTLFAFPNHFAEFDQVKLTQASGTTINGRFGTVAERTGPDAAAKRQAKRQAFRYCIFADRHSGGTSSGKAELPGNDFMVTLGAWTTAGGTSPEKAGTFMHELGHTLGLGHGGRDAVTGADGIVYKPNYYSIMNYTWQTPDSWMAPGTWPLEPGRFGYSTFALLDLNEADLFECQGVGAPAGALGNCPVPHNTHNSTSQPVAAGTSFMCCAIDWNNDDHVGCFTEPVAVDLNHLYDDNPASPGEVLRGREDWSKLVYDFKTFPDFADGSHLSAALVEEITLEEHQEVLASLPAFCLGDIDLDHNVTVDDLLTVITGWGPASNSVADVTGDGVVNVDDLLAVITNWGPCR